MRVFDFEGVREAVEEISGGLEKLQEDEVKINNAVGAADGGEEAKKDVVQDEPLKKEKAKRTYVPDSEDEEDDEEDEMLFETEGITATAPPVQTPAPVNDPQPTPKPLDQDRGAIKFILIDSLAHVIGPLLKKDFIQGTFLSFRRLHSDVY